ncbi:MAG: metallophosphoesterase family protein [Chloroflexi bacterium]|nr:metallophosphoesterase family protein [Chloroflexota bacterium]MBP7041141.1 metallophosphoesterase family protein [Chloroflexota bacterium]
MKIAIISDIHGNFVALETVLAALRQDTPDQIVCLGDVVVGGPQPREALTAVRELSCPVVMGNTDEWLLSPTPFTIRSQADQILYDVELWGANQLTDEDKASVRSFQPTVELDLGNGRSLLCFHGSPRHNKEVIKATTPDEELAEKLGGAQATIFAGGHTHTPLLRRIGDGFILNPGSVGLPFYRGADGRFINPARAEYALVTVENGRLDITLRRVAYHLDDLRTAVARSAMPHPDHFLADWVPGESQ